MGWYRKQSLWLNFLPSFYICSTYGKYQEANLNFFLWILDKYSIFLYTKKQRGCRMKRLRRRAPNPLNLLVNTIVGSCRMQLKCSRSYLGVGMGFLYVCV